MDAQDKQQFMSEAREAFNTQRATADACYQHQQDCFICRGMASKWTRWITEFLFICHEIRHLAFEAHVAKNDADEFRVKLQERARSLYAEVAALETPSLEWLDGLYALRDDREE